jgi:surface antigen
MSHKASQLILSLVVGAVIAGCGTTTTKTITKTVPAATPSPAPGGRGGGITSEGDSGGPWPGNDYPSALADPPQDSIMDPFGEDNRECVSYVAETLEIAFGYKLPFYGGNAVDWLGSATRAGVPSGTTPTQYSVAYSAANDHVALVVAVTGSGSSTQVTVEQYNQHLNGEYSWDVEPATDFDHYIYFLPRSRPGAATTTAPSAPASSPGSGASSPTNTVTVASPSQPSGQLHVTTAAGNGLGSDTASPQTASSPQPAPVNPQQSTSNPQLTAPSPQDNGGQGGGSTSTATASPPVTSATTTAASAPVTSATTTAATSPSTPTTYSEIAGGVSHTWSDPYDAGGSPGQTIQSQQTVQVSCVITNGFAVADGNPDWYRLAGDPWDGNFYVSADAFYNGAAPGGSLVGTPWVDPSVPSC